MIALILLLVGLALMAYAVVRAIRATAHRRRPWSGRATGGLAWAAVAWTVVAALVLVVAPMSRTVATASDGSDVVVTTTSSQTLLENEGASVILVLLVPVAIALAGAVGRGPRARRRRIAAGSVLTVACLLGAMSIGIFFVPAAALLLTAGLKAST